MRTTTAYMPRTSRTSTARIRLTNPFPALSAARQRPFRAGLDLDAPPNLRIVRSRKSPISTGLCDSAEFSTTIRGTFPPDSSTIRGTYTVVEEQVVEEQVVEEQVVGATSLWTNKPGRNPKSKPQIASAPGQVKTLVCRKEPFGPDTARNPTPRFPRKQPFFGSARSGTLAPAASFGLSWRRERIGRTDWEEA